MSSHAPVGMSAHIAKPVTALSRGGRIFMAVLLIIVFEGAVRKWVSASTSLPLIGLRDLLAVYLVFYAWRGGYFRRYQKVSTGLFAWTLLVIGWGLLQLVGGESSPTIFLIGLRFWLLYTWFAVAAAATMTETDYRAAVRLTVLVMLVLAPIALLQRYSPPGAAINRSLEGDEGDVFVVISGVVRTTGTFTFTSGYSTYLALVAPFVFGLLAARKRNRAQHLLAVAGFGAFIVGSVVSGSRGSVLSSGAMLGVYLIARLVFAKTRDKPAALGASLIAAALTAGLLFFLSDSIQVTQQRFEQASSNEDFGDRLLATFIGEPRVLDRSTWLGQGIGAGSNLATSLQKDATNFALAESETGRIVLEGGMLGFAFIALKLAVLIGGFAYCLRLSILHHAAVPMVLWLSMVMALMTWGAIGQLTANGFLGVLLGLFLLLFRYPSGDFFPARPSPS